MANRLVSVITSLCALLASSCYDAALPSQSLVDRPRVIAMTTPTPELRPGDRADVLAVVLAPGSALPLRTLWRLCDAATLADPRSCPTAPALSTWTSTIGVRLPSLLEGSYVLYLALCPGVAPVLDASTSHFRCGPDFPAEEAFRRIEVRASGPLNAQPAIARVELTRGDDHVDATGTPTLSLPRCAHTPCAPWALRVTPAPGSSELTPNGERESLVTSFYATAGAFDHPRATLNPGEEGPMSALWTLADDALTPSLAVVLRDQRDGETARTFAVTFR